MFDCLWLDFSGLNSQVSFQNQMQLDYTDRWNGVVSIGALPPNNFV